jgi:hypothetical protein
MTRKKLGFVAAIVVASVVSACGMTDRQDDQEAPTAEVDALAESDEGVAYNGWTQSIAGSVDPCIGIASYWQTFTRASGDATRGGGTCFVHKKPGTSCSSDTTCTTAAQAQYGASAWGYCYSGVCYSRPGSQSSFCALSPNRAPGTVGNVYLSATTTFQEHVLGCMTKTAGPNTACGGTNASLYMRTVGPATISCASWP